MEGVGGCLGSSRDFKRERDTLNIEITYFCDLCVYIMNTFIYNSEISAFFLFLFDPSGTVKKTGKRQIFRTTLKYIFFF